MPSQENNAKYQLDLFYVISFSRDLPPLWVQTNRHCFVMSGKIYITVLTALKKNANSLRVGFIKEPTS